MSGWSDWRWKLSNLENDASSPMHSTRKGLSTTDVWPDIHRSCQFYIPPGVLLKFPPAEIRAEEIFLPFVGCPVFRFVLIDNHVADRICCHVPCTSAVIRALYIIRYKSASMPPIVLLVISPIEYRPQVPVCWNARGFHAIFPRPQMHNENKS